MNNDSSRTLFRQILALHGIQWNRYNIISAAFDKDWKTSYVGTRDPNELMNKLEKYLKWLEPPDKKEIEKFLLEDMGRLSLGENTPPTLNNRLNELLEDVQNRLEALPQSINKAKESLLAIMDIGDLDTDQEYDILCLLTESVTNDFVTRIIMEWKEKLRNSIKEQQKPNPIEKWEDTDEGIRNKNNGVEEIEYRNNPAPVSYIFWTSLDDQELLDAVSRYRFLETFNIGDFSETMREIENIFAATFAEFDPTLLDWKGDDGWASIAFNLWLAQRSSVLCSKIRHYIETSLLRIVRNQHNEGWWPSQILKKADNQFEQIPDVYFTALACFVVLRLARNEYQIELAKRGVQWLAKQQLTDGAWASYKVDYENMQEDESTGETIFYRVLTPDLFTTLLSVEALRVSGLDGFDYSINLAENWILKQQKNDGLWDAQGFPFPFMSVLVLEHFVQKEPLSVIPGNYISIARDFVLRASEFVLEENENSRRLAIITAHHGIEAFLYECLSHPNINIQIFDKSGKTIGFRKAITNLEMYFQDQKILETGKSIEYRNQLDKLAYYRDEIVHKGVQIGKNEANEMTDAARRFSNLICRRIFSVNFY